MDVVLIHFDCVDLEVASSNKQLLAVFDGEYQMNEQEKLSVVFGS
jgi:hypothetical protein